MTAEFQLGLLKYLVQEPDGMQYIPDVDENIFDLVQHQIAVQVIRKYYRLYGIVPGQVAAKQFLEEEIIDTPDLNKEVVTSLRNTFDDLYTLIPLGDKVKLQDTLLISLQERQIDRVFTDYADGRITNDQLFMRMNKVAALAKDTIDDIYTDGGFLVADRHKHYDEQVEGHPTFLHDLNMLTAAKGFYSPQLIIFMSGPKHFKTGLMIKLAVEYARDGYKVYYADGENGARSVRNRAKMALMECTLRELFDPEIEQELDDVMYRFGKYMGGDLYIDNYPAGVKAVGDVKGRLQYLKEEYGFIPDIIFWDSIDHFLPTNLIDQKRDPRIQIQKVYHEVIALNKAIGCFSFAPSQVNRKAINKKVFDMTDLAEDFGKAMNSHCIMAICATEEEVEQGIRRIIPVAQREGVAYKGKNMCMIRVDEERMIVQELDKNDFLDLGDD